MSDVYVIREKKIIESFHRMITRERQKIEVKISNNLKNNIPYTQHDISKFNEKYKHWNPSIVCSGVIKIMEVEYTPNKVAYVKPRTIIIYHGNFKKQIQKRIEQAEIYLHNKYTQSENKKRKIKKLML